MRSVIRAALILACLFAVAPLVFADIAIPTTTTVYFQMNGQSYEKPVDYTVNCYGYNYSPDSMEAPADYDPANPDLVYTYQASCPEYGCEIDEGYYLNYRHIDSCDVEGETDGMVFKIENYATTPLPEDCEGDGLGRTCTQTFDIPELTEPEPVFTDVDSGNKYVEAIGYVKDAGIVEGYEDGSYKPDSDITRAEFTKIIIESAYSDTEIQDCVPTKVYPDIPTDEWYEKYVCVATNNGIIEGYPDGEFKGINKINFVEAAKIISLGFNFEVGSAMSGEQWYVPYVELLQSKNAIPADIDAVDHDVTRGEMAEMIYRLKEEITNKPSSQLL